MGGSIPSLAVFVQMDKQADRSTPLALFCFAKKHPFLHHNLQWLQQMSYSGAASPGGHSQEAKAADLLPQVSRPSAVCMPAISRASQRGGVGRALECLWLPSAILLKNDCGRSSEPFQSCRQTRGVECTLELHFQTNRKQNWTGTQPFCPGRIILLFSC